MGSSSSTTQAAATLIAVESTGQQQEQHQQEPEQHQPLRKNRRGKSNSSLKRQSSYKSSSPDSLEEEEAPGNLVDKPTILGFVEDLIGASSNHNKIVPINGDLEHTNNEIKPIFSNTPIKKSVSFTRPRNTSSLRDSLSSNDSSTSSTFSSSNSSANISTSTYPTTGVKMARMGSLRGNNSGNNPAAQPYFSWNNDSICWEEYKKRSMEQNKRKKTKDVSSSPIIPIPQSVPTQKPQKVKPAISGYMNNVTTHPSSPITFKKEPVTITNRVGMEVESSPLGNFLKGLSAPSALTQTISNK